MRFWLQGASRAPGLHCYWEGPLLPASLPGVPACPGVPVDVLFLRVAPALTVGVMAAQPLADPALPMAAAVLHPRWR